MSKRLTAKQEKVVRELRGRCSAAVMSFIFEVPQREIRRALYGLPKIKTAVSGVDISAVHSRGISLAQVRNVHTSDRSRFERQ